MSDKILPSDLKHLMKDHYIKYASYVILDRAIPDIVDGLKPVQRRILHTLYKMNDGKLHKVANVAGQTMAYHPHGDAPITDALVNLANKGFLLDQQGNFGNLLTGDPAAAPRYIETRLSDLALISMFNPDITDYIPSYDGRNKEPVTLPAKIPLLLMQGADGIAVGMSTRILPHNFCELLKAQIAHLEGEEFILYPDFLTGGMMDASGYDKGNGKVKLRAKIETTDQKTLVIREICYGTTTESLTRSIEEAAKRGKIKIDSINDYTAEKVEIEIKLTRGNYAEDLIDKLYAYTECEVSLSSFVTVIKEGLPVETNVDEVLKYNTELLKEYLKAELDLERDRHIEKVFEKTLEQIFIENRLYKKIEELGSYEEIHDVIEKSLVPFHKVLSRIPTHDDRERLLNIPIRRISRFDCNKNQDEIKVIQKKLAEVEKDLKQIKKVAISFLMNLLKTYGSHYPRRTEIGKIGEINKKEIETKEVEIGFDSSQNFVGVKVKGNQTIICTNFDKLLVLFDDGRYKVINIPEKEYLGEGKVAFVGVADKKTTFNVAYIDKKSKIAYAKRFIVSKFIIEKEYRYFPESGKLAFLSQKAEAQIHVNLVPKERQKISSLHFSFVEVLVKGVTANGVRISPRPVKSIDTKKGGAPQLDLFSS